MLVFALSPALVGVVRAAAAPPTFMGLGYLPGGSGTSSGAYGVSADASVVVGFSGSATSGSQAIRWTRPGGMEGLGLLPGGIQSFAFGASADGLVVAGSSIGSLDKAFRWTQAGGMVSLGYLPGGSSSYAQDVSANGSVVVGYGNSPSNYQAFRWTQAGGMIGLGFLPGGYDTRAHAVSADGESVVGDNYSGDGHWEAFRWTSAGGMVGLGLLPGFGTSSFANDVSADGSVVVGRSCCGSAPISSEAFRWTEVEGMVGLGLLPGGRSSVATGVSADGTIIVGYGQSASGLTEAFRWTQADGIRSLRDLLVNDYGLDLTGWYLSHARAVSADGMTIVGSGSGPSGTVQAWIAHIPEPATALLLLTAALLYRQRISS